MFVMNESNLTLYVGSDFVSAFAMSAFVALKEKELNFDLELIDLKNKKNYLPQYRNISLTCKVPTLVHNDFTLSESSAIAEYIESRFPSPTYKNIYPQDINNLARARQLQAWLRSDLLIIRQERPADLIYSDQRKPPLTQTATDAVDRLFYFADRLLDGGSENLFGEWCIADTDLAIMLNRLICNGDDVPLNLIEYVHKQWKRPSVQKWVELNHTQAKISQSQLTQCE